MQSVAISVDDCKVSCSCIRVLPGSSHIKEATVGPPQGKALHQKSAAGSMAAQMGSFPAGIASCQQPSLLSGRKSLQQDNLHTNVNHSDITSKVQSLFYKEQGKHQFILFIDFSKHRNCRPLEENAKLNRVSISHEYILLFSIGGN